MRFFTWFAAAMVWSIAEIGVASWFIYRINPDRPDISFVEAAVCLGILAVAGLLFIGGWVFAAERINRGL